VTAWQSGAFDSKLRKQHLSRAHRRFRMRSSFRRRAGQDVPSSSDSREIPLIGSRSLWIGGAPGFPQQEPLWNY